MTASVAAPRLGKGQLIPALVLLVLAAPAFALFGGCEAFARWWLP